MRGKSNLRRRYLLAAVLVLGALAVPAALLVAQEEAPAPPAKLGLAELVNMGLERQPSLAVARASLAAAESGQRGVNGLIFARLFAPDLPVRRQQACLGVAIASAVLEQAEWETRYAVVRNFYSIQYAREQLKVVVNVKDKLKEAHAKAKKLVDSGDANIKVTQIDVDTLALHLNLIKTKEAEASVGILKAHAALREALGVGLDCPLEVAVEPLPALVKNFNKEELVAQALANRAELVQAATFQHITELEVQAQGRMRFSPSARTFAQASDIHGKQIPQGRANGEYVPGADAPEFPTTLVGKRRDRMQRAGDFSDRASAVLDKTHNLITLEVEATYLKWKEASLKIETLGDAPKSAKDIARRVKERFDKGDVPGGELLQSQTLEDQIISNYNEALYLHALALAALERVTAGGYRLTSGR